jgi:hypothetical protein
LREALNFSVTPCVRSSATWSDKTGKYWVITFIGYAINLLAAAEAPVKPENDLPA